MCIHAFIEYGIYTSKISKVSKRTRLEAEMESPTIRKARPCIGEDEKKLFGPIQECLTSFHNLRADVEGTAPVQSPSI